MARYIVDTDDLAASLQEIEKEKRADYLIDAWRKLHTGKGNFPWVQRIKSDKTKKDGYSAEFEAFWLEYPKKTGKGGAYKAWTKVKGSKPALLAACLEALNWQKRTEQWVKDDGQFIPNPQTYINQARWEDECPPDLHPDKPKRTYRDMNGIMRTE